MRSNSSSISMKLLTKSLTVLALPFLLALPNSGHADVAADAKKTIEAEPPVLLTCLVQAFIMPAGNPDPRNQIIISTELLEKGFRTDRILAHDRIKQGSFYIFGTISQTLLKAQVEKQKPEDLKLEVAKKAQVIFWTGRTYRVSGPSIRVQGCDLKQLF